MNDREPPRLADWLLRRFGFVRRNPALTGDLLEMFRDGRSGCWYWREALVIVLHGLLRNAWLFRDYLGAVCFGWALQTAFAVAMCRLFPGPGRGFLSIAPAVAAWLAAPILMFEVKRRLFGRTAWSLQMLSRYDFSSMQRRTTLLGLVAAHTFAIQLGSYYFISRLFPLSVAISLLVEALWLMGDVIAVVLTPESTAGKP